MNSHRILFGGTDPLPEVTLLRAGKLSLVYEAGFLRYIRANDVEVLRMINHAVRDKDWDTLPFTITDEKIDRRDDSFSIRYVADVNASPIIMQWTCTIIGNADSSIEFEISGEIKNNFLRNRIGFTVLHPIAGTMGKAVQIGHPDGSRDESPFPTLISPHQPFKNIAHMQWQPGEHITASIEFNGDIFETEDQRNWIDDSYKTYCTPLENPFPVEVRKGDTVHQKIRLSVAGIQEVSRVTQEDFVSIRAGDARSPLPKIGVSKATGIAKLMGDDFKKIKELNLDHYRCEVRFSDRSWEAQYTEACREANELSLPLELALIFPEANVTTDMLTKLLENTNAPIASITLLSESSKVTPEFILSTAGPFLRTMGKVDKVGAGTSIFFTELNRNRITSPGADYLSWSINPQVHAFDNRTLVENLQAIPYMMETARHFGQEKSLHISPITFKIRRQDEGDPNSIPRDADPRQASLLGAGWTAGCIKYLSQSGAHWITLFETVGCKGLARGSSSSPFWDGFDLAPEDVYPIWHVLQWLGEFRGGEIIHTTSSNPLEADGLVVTKGGKKRMILINFSSEKKTIRTEIKFSTIRVLDEENFMDSTRNTAFFHHHESPVTNPSGIELPAFAIARLDE